MGRLSVAHTPYCNQAQRARVCTGLLSEASDLSGRRARLSGSPVPLSVERHRLAATACEYGRTGLILGQAGQPKTKSVKTI